MHHPNAEMRRATPGRVEYQESDGRASRQDDSLGTIHGYGAVFYDGTPGTQYELIKGRVVERIMPGTFDRALRERQDVRGLFNHAADNILGRTSSGTMKLSIDKTGLQYSIRVPGTTLGRDMLVSLKRGDVSGSSFSFVVVDERFREEKGIQIREVLDVNLFDVGPVTFPAYVSATSGARGVAKPVGSAEWLQDERVKLAARKRKLDQHRVYDPKRDLLRLRLRMLEARKRKSG